MSKNFRVLIHPDAETDLEKISAFIAESHPQNAKRFLMLLRKRISELRHFPLRGSQCSFAMSEKSQPIRYLTFKGYLVFYEVISDQVVVLHVTAPGMDWMKSFL